MKKSEALRILGLSESFTDDEVKAAHRKKVVEFHPDKFISNPVAYEKAEEQTKLINESRDVLLSRKWTPEFGSPRAGNPYASPYNPYGGSGPFSTGGAGQEGQGSPYEGWPFGQGQPAWVWTSWSDVSSNDQTRSNPFDPFNATKPEKTPEERREEAKKDLINEVRVVSGKLIGLGVFSVFGLFPLGLLLYVVVSLIYGLWKRMSGCLMALFIPAVVVLFIPALIFIAPRASSLVIVLIIVCVICVVFDIVNIARKSKAYRSARVV